MKKISSTGIHRNTCGIDIFAFQYTLVLFSYCFFGVIFNFAVLECSYGLTHGYEFIILLTLWGTSSYVRKRWWWKHQCKALKILLLKDILLQKNLKAGFFVKALECFIISWHTPPPTHTHITHSNNINIRCLT